MRRGTWRLLWSCSRRRRVLGPLGRLGAACLLPTLVPWLRAEETPRIVTSQTFHCAAGRGAALQLAGTESSWVSRAPQPPSPRPLSPALSSALLSVHRALPSRLGVLLAHPGLLTLCDYSLTSGLPADRKLLKEEGCVSPVSGAIPGSENVFSEETSISVAACSLSAGLCCST